LVSILLPSSNSHTGFLTLTQLPISINLGFNQSKISRFTAINNCGDLTLLIVKEDQVLLFLLQLGFCAKLKSLRVIETLRKARIPLYQALCRDKLISQLSSVERLRIPYSIILGQREALENSVIIRNTSTRAQETVGLHNLVEYLRKMKLG